MLQHKLSEIWMKCVTQVDREHIFLMRNRQTSLPVRFVSLYHSGKPNYALFPLIKLLISADWFRNMKQERE